jgi:hypothetical protein
MVAESSSVLCVTNQRKGAQSVQKPRDRRIGSWTALLSVRTCSFAFTGTQRPTVLHLVQPAPAFLASEVFEWNLGWNHLKFSEGDRRDWKERGKEIDLIVSFLFHPFCGPRAGLLHQCQWPKTVEATIPLYEAQNLLGCTAVFLIQCRQTFQSLLAASIIRALMGLGCLCSMVTLATKLFTAVNSVKLNWIEWS